MLAKGELIRTSWKKNEQRDWLPFQENSVTVSSRTNFLEFAVRLSLYAVQMQSLHCTVPLLCETKRSGPAESIKGDKYEKVRGSQRACPVQL